MLSPSAAAAAAAGPPLKSLDESFVVLPGSASVLLPGSGTVTSSSRDPTAGPGSLGSGSNTALRHNHQQQSFSTAGPAAGTGGSSATAAVLAAVTAGKAADRATRSSSGNARAAGMSMDTKIDKDAALFELASTVTGVDHPLCLDCAAQLKSDVDKEIVALEAETKAYSEALAKLNAEAPAALSQVRALPSTIVHNHPYDNCHFVLWNTQCNIHVPWCSGTLRATITFKGLAIVRLARGSGLWYVAAGSCTITMTLVATASLP